MTKIYDISAVTWSYEKDWKLKNTYSTIWKMIEKEDWKRFIKIDTLPLGNRDGRASIFERKDKKTSEKTDDGYDLPF